MVTDARLVLGCGATPRHLLVVVVSAVAGVLC